MFWKKKNSIFHSVVFRLSLWYALFFSIAAILVFFISKSILSSDPTKIIDYELLHDSQEYKNEFLRRNIEEMIEELHKEASEEGLGRVFYRLLSSDYTEISSSNLNQWNHLDLNKLKNLAKLSSQKDVVFETLTYENNQLNTRVISRKIGNGNYILQIGFIIQNNQALMESFRYWIFWIFIALLVCGIILGWWIMQKTMSGVKRVAETAVKIGKDGLVHRVETKNEGTEIDNLAEAFNNMLNRIEKLMSELTDITNNVAHDLRTPITRIRGIAETSLKNNANSHSNDESYSIIIEECDRLVYLVNTILEISEIQAGIKKYDQTNIEIIDLVERGCDIFQPVAEDKNIKLKFEGQKTPIYIQGNMNNLQRAVSNLLDNAIKFTQENGEILVRVTKSGHQALISFKDTGIGIKQENIKRIFEKFFRVQSSRSTPGNGLGLSWAQSIISTMNGKITVQSELGTGSTFIIHIPLYSTTLQ